MLYNNSTVQSLIFDLSRLASESVEPFKTCELKKKSYPKLCLFIIFAKKKSQNYLANPFLTWKVIDLATSHWIMRIKIYFVMISEILTLYWFLKFHTNFFNFFGNFLITFRRYYYFAKYIFWNF